LQSSAAASSSRSGKHQHIPHLGHERIVEGLLGQLGKGGHQIGALSALDMHQIVG